MGLEPNVVGHSILIAGLYKLQRKTCFGVLGTLLVLCTQPQNQNGEDNKPVENFHADNTTTLSKRNLSPTRSDKKLHQRPLQATFPPNCHTSGTVPGSGTSAGALTVTLAASASTTRCMAAASMALSATTRSMSSGGEHSMWT